LLEVAPAIIGAVVLLWTYKNFRLSALLYFFILIHCVVLMVGGHYTYAEVPLFSGLENIFGVERNNYDKLGHFFQGLVPALITREVLLRKQVVNGRGWLNLYVVSVSLAISAFYELIEWWVALASGEDAEKFLGTQGYIWDTQSDMALALVGAVLAILVFSRQQDKQIKNIAL
jgi:putative membrane protein